MSDGIGAGNFTEQAPRPNDLANGNEDATRSESWGALFSFTTKMDMPILLLGLVSSSAVGAASPAISRITGAIINQFTSYSMGSIHYDDFLRETKLHIIYLVAVASLNLFVGALALTLWLAFGEVQAKRAREQLFTNLLERELSWYDTREHGINALLSRAQAQVKELQLATAQPLSILVTSLSTAILSLIQALIYSWKLTLVTLASVPPITLLAVLAGNKAQSHLAHQTEKLTAAGKASSIALSAIEVVKCFNAQEMEATRFTRTIREAALWYLRLVRANAIQTALIVLLSILLFVQGFYYGSVLIRKGELGVGDVITTFLSAVSAFISISSVLPQMLVLEKGRASGARLHTLTIHERNFDRHHGLLAPKTCRGTIKFIDVTFAYPSRSEQPVLNNISLFIPAGETVFLIGKSGCGKSTVGQLLARFYSAKSGNIAIDEVPLDSLDINWLRSNVTLVEQTGVLFNDTISNNIAFGNSESESIALDKIESAAEFALLRMMLFDLPDGLDTLVGSQGNAMSGGQRQRIALARARLRDTPILILDECTSALDAVNRGLMMEAIRRWRRGKTTIIITHDLTQILPHDYVYILDQGKVVHDGYRRHLEALTHSSSNYFITGNSKAPVASHDGNNHEFAMTLLQNNHEIHNRVDSNRASRIMRSYFSPQYDSSTDLELNVMSRVSRDSRFSLGSQIGQQYPSCTDDASWPHSSASTNVVGCDASQLDSHCWRFSLVPLVPEHCKAKAVSIEKSKSVRGNLLQIPKAARTTSSSSRRRQLISCNKRNTSLTNRQKSLVDGCSQAEAATFAEYGAVPQQSVKQIMSTLCSNIDSKQRLALFGAFWAATLHGLNSPVTSYLLAKLIQTYTVEGGDAHLALVYSFCMLGLAVADAIATFLYRTLFEYVGQCWIDKLRDKAFRRVLDQPRMFFDKPENKISHITASLDRHAEEMRNLLGRFCGLVYIASVIALASVLWALIAQWKLTLVTLAVGPCAFGITRAFATISARSERRSNTAAEKIGAICTETFTNIRTIRCLTLERHFSSKHATAIDEALKLGFKRSILTGLFFGIAESSGDFMVALMFYIGALLVKGDQASVSRIVQVFVILMFAITNLSVILDYIPQISASKDAASRLLRLVQLPRDSYEHIGYTTLLAPGEINFHELSFSYPSRPDQIVLNNVNLRIRSGMCTAIVGGSGSGKSTLASLLLKLYDTSCPSKKRRRTGCAISGRSVVNLDTVALRSMIAIIPQTPTVFPATVFENITYGLSPNSPYATTSAVVSAAQQAGLHEFISSLPEGYQTQVGEGGSGLSGGQAQRLAIARALVRRPAILILDEATSALDAMAVNEVKQTVRKLVNDASRGTTVIVITHDHNMMDLADNIVVLERGRVVEEGPFEVLMARRGALAEMLSSDMGLSR